jgi:uncharacterized protein (TIRG00374 family)
MKINKSVLVMGKMLISSGLLYLLYHRIPVHEVAELLATMQLWYLVPVSILLISNTVLSALKWKLFLQADDVDISLTTLTATYLIGSFYNMFLPSTIGGDSYRIYDVAQKSRQGIRTAASVFADRFSGFLALVTLGLLSSIVVASRFEEPLFFLGPLFILVVLFLLLVALYKQTPIRVVMRLTRLDRFTGLTAVIEKFFLSFDSYGADRRLLGQVMGISFAFQLSVICIVYLLARALHAQVPFIYFSAFVPLIGLMEILPLSINGIGLRDAGYVFFFGWAGMTDIQTRSLAILFLAMSICYSLIGGVVYLIRIYILQPDRDSRKHRSSINNS